MIAVVRFTEEDKRKMMEEVVTVALHALRLTKRNCPVDTGRLRDSYTVVDSEGIVQGPGNNARPRDAPERPDNDFVVRLGTNVEYAPYVEFGTVHMEAQPHVRPAVDQALNRSKSITS